MAVPRADSVNLTSNGLVHTGYGALVSVALTAAGDTATATVYDNTAGSGTVICVLKAAANTCQVLAPAAALGVSTGIYVVLAGTTPNCCVAYTR